MYGYELAFARKRRRDEIRRDLLYSALYQKAYDDAEAVSIFRAGTTRAPARSTTNLLVAWALWKLGMPIETLAPAYDTSAEQLASVTLDVVRYSQTIRDQIEAEIAIDVPETPHAVGDQAQPDPLYLGIGRRGAHYGASIH